MFGRGLRPHWLIVGLGNPGPSYRRTRHNVGAELVERLATRCGVDLQRQRGKMRLAEADVEGVPVVLSVPLAFMNESGRPIARLARKQNLKPHQILVVQDELDLKPGTARLKQGGGTAGHNGLRSLEASLRSRDFVRLRIGVGKPPSKHEGAGHVLSSMPPDVSESVSRAIHAGIDAIGVLVREGVDAAMNELHTN